MELLTVNNNLHSTDTVPRNEPNLPGFLQVSAEYSEENALQQIEHPAKRDKNIMSMQISHCIIHITPILVIKETLSSNLKKLTLGPLGASSPAST